MLDRAVVPERNRARPPPQPTLVLGQLDFPTESFDDALPLHPIHSDDRSNKEPIDIDQAPTSFGMRSDDRVVHDRIKGGATAG